VGGRNTTSTSLNTNIPATNNNNTSLPRTNNTTNNVTQNNTNTTPVNTVNAATNNTMPVEDGIVFRVQIGAFRDEVPLEIANKFLKITKKGIKNYKDDNGLTIYSVGSYRNYEDAAAAKAEVIAEGINDAFIVAYQNGKKISMDEAKELMKK
jgi:cell division protein FtsN